MIIWWLKALVRGFLFICLMAAIVLVMGGIVEGMHWLMLHHVRWAFGLSLACIILIACAFFGFITQGTEDKGARLL